MFRAASAMQQSAEEENPSLELDDALAPSTSEITNTRTSVGGTRSKALPPLAKDTDHSNTSTSTTPTEPMSDSSHARFLTMESSRDRSSASSFLNNSAKNVGETDTKAVADEDDDKTTVASSSSSNSMTSIAATEAGMDNAQADYTQQVELTLEKANSRSSTESAATTTTSTSTSNNNESIPKKVSFGTMQVRDYPITLGVNPSVQGNAPPISIDWHYQHAYTLSIDDYEDSRPQRRAYEELRIPPSVRTERLRCAGYSTRELQEQMKEVNLARARRARNYTSAVTHPFWDDLRYVVEKTVRGTCNATIRRGRKEQERKQYRDPFLNSNVSNNNDNNATSDVRTSTSNPRQSRRHSIG